MSLAHTQMSGVRELARNPSGTGTSLDGAVAIQLGKVIELVVGGRLVKTGRAPLLWFPQWKSLVFFEGVRASSPSSSKLAALEESTRITRQMSAFEKWARREAKQSREMTFPAGARKWLAIGRAERIDYWSDKKGSKHEYTHDFGQSVRGYILQRGRKTAMWVIRGGRMTVTERGIVG